ncbi:MAG: hypothetical protein K2O18_05275 [Oscillospiraceae bacterium]|nr:hypothetical protein [Oscillospiraceae bacterium]
MKKRIVLLFALIFCLASLNGCSLAAAAKNYDIPDAQQIVVSDSATGEVLATLTGEQEINAF